MGKEAIKEEKRGQERNLYAKEGEKETGRRNMMKNNVMRRD